MQVRCNQCKAKLEGKGTGREHAKLTRHVWQPGYPCGTCDAAFSSHMDRKKHLKTCRGTPQSSAKVPAAITDTTIATLAEYRTFMSDIVTCPECQEHFRDSETLTLHRAEHITHGEPTASSSKPTALYPCGVCKLEFTSNLTLLQHRKVVSPCDICAVCIPHEMMSLQDHFRQSNMHPKCRGCGLGLATLWDWTNHRHSCKAPILETAPAVPVESAANASLYAAADHTLRDDYFEDSADAAQAQQVSSGATSPSLARTRETLAPDIPLAQVGGIAREIASTLSTAFSTLGSVSYVVHDPESPTTLQNLSSLRDASPRAEFDLELPASSATTAFDPVLDAGPPQLDKSPRPEHHSPTPEHEEEPELEADADADVGSTAERSSLIAKAALDLIAQRFGAQAAERVVRVMQALGAAPAEGEPDPDPDPEPEDAVPGGGETSTRKRAPMFVSVLDPDGASVCSAGRSSPSEVGIASPCSPSCAVSPPDVAIDDACSEVEAEVEIKPASVYETPIPARTPSPLALSIHSTPSTLADAETDAHSVHELTQGVPLEQVSYLGGTDETRDIQVVEPVKTRAPGPSPSWHCRSCMRNPCVDPVATICGHLFCQSCLMRELGSHGACPVCKKTFLIMLDVGVSGR